MAARFIKYALAFLAAASTALSEKEKIPLYYDSDTYEFIRGTDRDTIFMQQANFRHGDITIYADTAIWIKGERIILNGDVFIEDPQYQLSADRVDYNIDGRSANACGDSVFIVSTADSIASRSTNAYYSRDSLILRMKDRPSICLNYPDSSRLIHIDADRVAVNAQDKICYADGHVIISQSEAKSLSGRAIMYTDKDILLLLESPLLERKKSEIKGDTLVLCSQEKLLRSILVFGSAEGYFKEPVGGDSTVLDTSCLTASEIEFDLTAGKLDSVMASGQAHSFYQPGTKDSVEVVRNNVSGDTIRLYMDNDNLSWIHVKGGAEGEYLKADRKVIDTTEVFVEDTVAYSSEDITYLMRDSTISLTTNGFVESKSLSLSAQKIKYHTSREIVTAFDDSVVTDSGMQYYPVILKDATEEILGSYLEYSLKTDRGLIIQSKSEYQDAYYRGRQLYRRKKDVYYVNGGSYTSCNLEEPHYHFYSKNMKMVQNDKLIARPVVFYIEKIPLLWIPYYVFPTRPGRHSGFLSFRFGNFERAQRYISNVGYYWAASEYWDIFWAVDYNENFGFNYRSTLRYNWRYHMDGSLSGSFADESQYINYQEFKSKRWQVGFNHAHIVSPTFSIRADGQFLSDKRYYTDYSINLQDRLNRNLRSQVSLSKRWERASLSGRLLHEVALDQEKRTDLLPTISFSLPSWPVFGSPSKGSDGQESRRFYHNFYTRYNVNLNNYSYRITDTAGSRSRKKYLTVDHQTSLSSSFSLLTYLRLNPSFNYQETWYKIFETDQSRAKGIDASTIYRRGAYSTSVSASTDLYGTVYFNFLKLQGLRHTITPAIGFSWAPEITKNDDIKSYTGTGGGGGKSKTMSFSLGHFFQARVKDGENSKKVDLFDIKSAVNYNFEAEGRKFSYLSTRAQTSLLKNLSISADMTHDLYEEGTDKLHWWSPYLLSFSIDTRFATSGILGEYQEAQADSTSAPPSASSTFGSRQKWSLSVVHHYSEYGRGSSFSKIHQASFNLNLNLTPTIKVTYSQNYDFTRHKTIYRKVEVAKNLHCWEGYFYWIPDGSTKGYYFRINVITIPDIKMEKTETGVRTPFSF
jgi:lipopolysaccharide assembly outer membrane protein LptD (OstA)